MIRSAALGSRFVQRRGPAILAAVALSLPAVSAAQQTSPPALAAPAAPSAYPYPDAAPSPWAAWRPAQHCVESGDCGEKGRCTERDGKCVSGSALDCQSSLVCRDRGMCSPMGEGCAATEPAQCAWSRRCFEGKQCLLDPVTHRCDDGAPRHSPAMIASGAATLAGGAVAIIAGVLYLLAGSFESSFAEFAGHSTPGSSPASGIGAGLVIGGALTSFVGIPLLVVGAEKIPRRGVPLLRVGAGSASLECAFLSDSRPRNPAWRASTLADGLAWHRPRDPGSASGGRRPTRVATTRAEHAALHIGDLVALTDSAGSVVRAAMRRVW